MLMGAVETGEIEVNAATYDRWKALAVSGEKFVLCTEEMSLGLYEVTGVRADTNLPASSDPFRVFIRIQAVD
jgi:hypothetical protein